MRHRTTLLIAGSRLPRGCVTSLAQSQPAGNPEVEIGPRSTAAGEPGLPAGFPPRVVIGSPLTPHGPNGGNAGFPEFHDVYVEPAAHDHYVENGVWPLN
ncbi:MAG: hypothetical protein R3E86_22135 [Pseudomonadales bacterium]